MKTPQEISEMAEREYQMPKGVHYLDSPTTYKSYLLQQGFIKGYQAAQDEMKQCPTCKSLSDTWDNEKDEQFNNL